MSISSFNISPSDNPALADSALETIYDLCKELGLVFFLYGGTALSLFRDGDYVKDNDIDITVVSSLEEYQNLWGRLAGLPGWSGSCGLRKGGIQLDLHYTDREAPYYIIPSWRPETYIFYEFDTISYRDRIYNVPAPIEDYLEWEFSGLWKMPMPRETWLMLEAWLERLLLGEGE